MMTFRTVPLLAALVLSATLNAHAGDWPQWRGPQRDGRADSAIKFDALPKEAKTLWSVPVGVGQASPVVVGNKVIYLDDQGGQETAHCLDLASGKEQWHAAFDQTESWGNAYGAGPRCTPVADGDRVYVQSCRGEFRCLALADGKTIWRTSFEKDWGASWFGNAGNNAPEAKETASRRHGNNGSAVIDGDRIFVPVGSPEKGTLVAFDKKTGKVLWTAGNENTAYSSVMVATLGGVRQAVHLTADALMGVDVKDGKILWRTPVKSGAKRHVLTPVIADDSITISSSSVGLTKFKVTKDSGGFKVGTAWKNDALKITLTTPVLTGNHLYGLGTGAKTDMVCVDFNTGEIKWRQPGFGDYAAFIAVGDKLLVQDMTGVMMLIKASPEKFEELGRVQVCGNTWSHPAFANGKLLQRDKKQLFALELAK
ncbi:MAG: PQQ-binding-like beta-propeller repeat protein [Verrucomicrobia bacterium]|nr:PQQ-binding-like beta-propeller repeat protein [Verrucomicrobiota bacterium]